MKESKEYYDNERRKDTSKDDFLTINESQASTGEIVKGW